MRDAQGNIMAVYRKKANNNNEYELRLQQQPIYGSSRLGVLNSDSLIAKTAIADWGLPTADWELPTAAATATAAVIIPNTNLFAGIIYQTASKAALLQNIPTEAYYSANRGYKHYELSNHLGNVLVTISDRKLPISITANKVEYYFADVVSVSDYYPFGMLMPGRSINDTTYRFGFNGQEKDDEIYGEGNSLDFGSRIYDSRVGRFLSVDPQFKKFADISPYVFCFDNPLKYIDKDGEIPWPVSATFNLNNITFNRGVASGWLRNSWPYHGASHKAADLGFKLSNSVQVEGAPIVATHQGKVIFAGLDPVTGTDPNNKAGYGYKVVIQYKDELKTVYGHMQGVPSVTTDQEVAEGQIIGYIGSTGYSFGPHVHYELWVKDPQTSLLVITNPFVGDPDYVPNFFDPVTLKDPQKMLGLPSIADISEIKFPDPPSLIPRQDNTKLNQYEWEKYNTPLKINSKSGESKEKNAPMYSGN